MNFKVKGFTEVLSSMASYIKKNNSKLNYFYPGGVLRTILEAISSEISGMYAHMKKVFPDILKSSITTSFGFEQLPERRSTGIVTVTFSHTLTERVTIPLGTKFFTVPINGKSIYFESIEIIETQYGKDTVDVPVRCSEPGIIGNVGAYTIVRCSTMIPYKESVCNKMPFIDGVEQESIEDMKIRFAKYIDSTSKGTVKALEYACYIVDGVQGAYIDEHIGYVNIYVHDSEGNLPESLKQEVEKSLYNYRCAGLGAIVLPVDVEYIDMKVSVILDDSIDTEQYRLIIEGSVRKYIRNLKVGSNLIIPDLIKFLMNLDPMIISVNPVVTNTPLIGVSKVLRDREIEVVITK